MIRVPLLATAVVLAASSALAHDTWLLPARFAVSPGADVTMDLTSAERFPQAQTAVKADRIARSGMRIGERRVPLRAGSAGETSLRIEGRAPSEGIAAAWLELHPRTLSLTDALVEEYLREIGMWDTAGAQWQASGRRPWKETYVKCAKAFVRVGDGAADGSWSQPVGLALEIVPESDPTRVAAGGSLTVRLLRQGSPLAGQPVAAQPAGGDAVLGRTDAEGRVRFVLDREGAWLVKATALRRLESGDWASEFSTVTLAVERSRGR